MNRSVLTIAAMVGFSVAALFNNALGQEKSSKVQLAGTWKLVSIGTVRPDGNVYWLRDFGAAPKSRAIFDSDARVAGRSLGRYIISVMRSDLPAFAANDRMQGTADENKAVAQGTLTYFGTYTFDEARSMQLRIDGSSFPNWTGTEQMTPVILIGKEECHGGWEKDQEPPRPCQETLRLTILSVPTGGLPIEMIWKRAP